MTGGLVDAQTSGEWREETALCVAQPVVENAVFSDSGHVGELRNPCRFGADANTWKVSAMSLVQAPTL